MPDPIEPEEPYTPQDLVTYDDIAEMSGGKLKAASLRMTASRGELPERAHPKFPLWDREDIAAWLREKGIEPR